MTTKLNLRLFLASFMAMVAFAGCKKIDEEIDEAVNKYVFLTFTTENTPDETTVLLSDFTLSGVSFNNTDKTSGSITVTDKVPFVLTLKTSTSSSPTYVYTPYTGTIDRNFFDQTNNDVRIVVNNLVPSIYVNNVLAAESGSSSGNGGGGNGGGGGGGSNVDTLVSQLVDGDVHEKKIVRFNVPSGAKTLSVRLTEFDQNTERNTADLFVRKGSDPIVNHDIQSNNYTWTADCAGTNPNREDELCTFNNPGSGQWSVMLYGYNTWFTSRLVVTITK